ncbi:MAG: cytidine deaminase [Nitratireductor sp.]|nr:cytidine deaminase [Nitratireductor sp.]MCB1457282.1 cytidine deaminase [Nitratireductor sp.]
MAADLHRLAVTAMARTHSPYSSFPVGAAILTEDGRTYAGCNIENASYPEGWCAETTAISHMVMDGGGIIAEVAVVAVRHPAITPCGGCRQRLAEFGKSTTLVHLCDMNGVMETVTLGELLPRAFELDADA